MGLWHHSMYGSPIVFRVSLNNFIYTVGPVDGRSLLKKWTHIMVSWNTEKTSFYINGTSVGWSFHFPSRKEQVEPENAKLFIGRDTVNRRGCQTSVQLLQTDGRSFQGPPRESRHFSRKLKIHRASCLQTMLLFKLFHPRSVYKQTNVRSSQLEQPFRHVCRL